MGIWKKWERPHWLALAFLALVAGWWFYRSAIAPQRERESEMRRSVAALKAQIASGRRVIGEIQELETRLTRERRELASERGDLPAGSAMIWLPELVKEHFGRLGITVWLVRLNTTQEQANIPGYDRAFWSVALPVKEKGREVAKLLRAVADLERQNFFIRVLDFVIRPDPENPDGPVASMNLTALVRK